MFQADATIARVQKVTSAILAACKEDESVIEAFRDVLPFVKKPGYAGLADAFDTALQAAGTSEGHLEGLCNLLDDGLGDLNADGIFGSEGQTDPRGDFREGDWSMWRVQGLDS